MNQSKFTVSIINVVIACLLILLFIFVLYHIFGNKLIITDPDPPQLDYFESLIPPEKKPVIVFDYDQTLVDDHGKLFPQIEEIILFLKEDGHTLAIASYNHNAEKYIERHNLHHHFTAFEAFWHPKVTKRQHLEKLSQKLGVECAEMILFDDLWSNINETKHITGLSVLVSPETGVTRNDVLKALKKYSKTE